MAAASIERSEFIEVIGEIYGYAKRKVTKVNNLDLVPPNLLAFIASRQAWDPTEFEDERRYILYLSEEDKLDLDEALAFFNGKIQPDTL